MYKLNKALKLSTKDKLFLTELNENKPNMPETKLTKFEISCVEEIYYQYISKVIDDETYNEALYREFKKERWMCGKVTKRHEAKRIILDHLLQVNKMGNLTIKEASNTFLCTLSYVPSYRAVVASAYTSK